MAETLETVKPKRQNENGALTIDIDSHDDDSIVLKQGGDWIWLPADDLPALIAALQRVADLVLK